MPKIEVIRVEGIPEVEKRADLASLISEGMGRGEVAFEDHDVVVVKQKVISKAEGMLVRLDSVKPGAKAVAMAQRENKDPRLVELILRESVRIVRVGHGVIITETKQGFVCANAGIDKSNVKDGYVSLLPRNPDASARKLRRSLERLSGKSLAVIVTDTFGRPWRKGQTDVAIGCSGIIPLLSYRGKKDRFGYELRVTEPAVVDEIAAAAELAAGKLDRVPVAIVRGAEYRRGETGVRTLLMERSRDLFR